MMKITYSLLAASLALSFSIPAWASGSVVVNVKGMVCSFCAQGLTKKFKSEDAVKDVKVKMSEKEKLVTLKLKEGKNLSDQTITEMIKDSGFSVENIKRD